jgi:cell filamentation protein
MKDEYKYIDPDYTYSDPETGILRNFLGKGYALNLNPPDNSEIYERYMSGTIDSDVEKLTALILELLMVCPPTTVAHSP